MINKTAVKMELGRQLAKLERGKCLNERLDLESKFLKDSNLTLEDREDVLTFAGSFLKRG